MLCKVLVNSTLLVWGLTLLCSGCTRTSKTHTGTTDAPRRLSAAEFQAFSSAPPDYRLAYGEGANQFGELRVPAGGGLYPVVVLIHGGCWKEPYAVLRDLGPLGDALKKDGIATWNIEYRRLYEPGSGWPGTYLDIGHALDHLRLIAKEHRLDLNRIVVLGHSAGGHLAMWAAARARLPKESPLYVDNPLQVRGVINLAGTMDMTDNIKNMEAGCRDKVVTGMLGGTPQEVPERYAQVSVMSLVPLGVPQILIWGEYEEFVPLPLAQKYVNMATRAGDTARINIVPGVGHFDLASPFTKSWPVLRSSIKAMLDGTPPD